MTAQPSVQIDEPLSVVRPNGTDEHPRAIPQDNVTHKLARIPVGVGDAAILPRRARTPLLCLHDHSYRGCDVLSARILVVDDEPGMVENCARILRRSGYRCFSTTDPRRALALIESGIA